MTAVADIQAGAAVPPPFGEYAAVYDLLYQDKDYPAEAAYVAELLRRHAPRRDPMRVVDLACGTGRHAMELAARGYAVEASDISADMIGIARRAAEARGLGIRFHHQPLQTAAAIGGPFEAALAMFASLGYLTGRDELAAAFGNVRRLLAPEGIFVFDVWNGPAVLRDFSAHRIKRMSGNGLSVERVSRTSIDEPGQIADVRFEFKVTGPDGAVSEFGEHHRVRFFFPRELEALLQASGFAVAASCPFMRPNEALGEKDWNMTFIARRQ